jgi:dihydrodipicolinate reductase
LTKSKRKKHHKLLRDARTGTPLTQQEWIAETKRVEETDYRKTALKDGLLKFMRAKGLLSLVFLITASTLNLLVADTKG